MSEPPAILYPKLYWAATEGGNLGEWIERGRGLGSTPGEPPETLQMLLSLASQPASS